jgi:two-component system, chemotaxis family, chemotaxis protein CheY
MPKVLVVDDDENVRHLLFEAFTKASCEVLCAADGAEAIELMRHDYFDVVVSDVVMPVRHSVGTISDLKRNLLMPERDGLDSIAAIKDNYPEAKIIAISGSVPERADEYLAKAKALGACRVFRKPFSVKELTKAVLDISGFAAKPPSLKRRTVE